MISSSVTHISQTMPANLQLQEATVLSRILILLQNLCTSCLPLPSSVLNTSHHCQNAQRCTSCLPESCPSTSTWCNSLFLTRRGILLPATANKNSAHQSWVPISTWDFQQGQNLPTDHKSGFKYDSLWHSAVNSIKGQIVHINSACFPCITYHKAAASGQSLVVRMRCNASCPYWCNAYSWTIAGCQETS